MGAFDDIIAAHGDKPPVTTQGRNLGSYTVSGPGQVTSKPPDPYAGVEMKKGRTTLDRAQDFILGLMGKGGDFSQMVNPSMFTGVVANPKNAAWMKDIMKGWLKDNPNMTDMELGMNYMKLKYPKIFSLAKGWGTLPENEYQTVINPEGGLPIEEYRMNPRSGAYIPSTGEVYMTPRPGQDVGQYVNTAGHELTHAMQFTRDPIGSVTTHIPPNSLGGADPILEWRRYADQPMEVGARQAGETAAATFDKFRNLMAGPTNQAAPSWTSAETGPTPFRDAIMSKPAAPSRTFSDYLNMVKDKVLGSKPTTSPPTPPQ